MKSTIAVLVLATIGIHTKDLLIATICCAISILIILKSNKNE